MPQSDTVRKKKWGCIQILSSREEIRDVLKLPVVGKNTLEIIDIMLTRHDQSTKYLEALFNGDTTVQQRSLDE